jgi:superfamily II DNA helicase RecQ
VPVESDPAPLDEFIMKHVPVALDLEEELGEQTRRRRRREAAEAAAHAPENGDDATGESLSITEARDLSEDESLRVRKVLACAARMGGRFGKGLLAATLRGSRSAKISQAGLDTLSTYGILNDMTQDEITVYIDALVAAGCLTLTTGTYPTVSLSPLGANVMRERASVRLALPAPVISYAGGGTLSPAARARSLSSSGSVAVAARPGTVDETYALYEQGLTIEEIAAQRALTLITVEKHLADCILEGRPFDVSRHVGEEDRALIEVAVEQLGTERLKPLRDALPPHITYRMIRFAVADMQFMEKSE